MTVIYCCLEKENFEALKFHMNNFSDFEKKHLPFLSATPQSFKIK